MLGSGDIQKSDLKDQRTAYPSESEHEKELLRLSSEWRKQRCRFHHAKGTQSRPGSAAALTRPPEELVAAASSGNVEVCKQLLESGVQPSSTGPDGVTALYTAALAGHATVVQLLLDAAADPAQRNNDNCRATALHASASHCHGKVCATLLQAGADACAADANGIEPRDYASCSEAVWPHFAAAACERTAKEVLVGKGLIKKTSSELELDLQGSQSARGDRPGTIRDSSRPGSAYVVSSWCPSRPASRPTSRPTSGARRGFVRRAGTGRCGSTSLTNGETIDVLESREGQSSPIVTDRP